MKHVVDWKKDANDLNEALLSAGQSYELEKYRIYANKI